MTPSTCCWRSTGSNTHRFADEMPLTASSVIVGDPDEGEPPDIFKGTGARYVPLQMKKMAKGIPGSWVNMVALGFAGALAGLPQDALEAAVRSDWKRGEAALAANLAALAAGYAAERGITPPIEVPQLPRDEAGAKTRWSITGNEAAGFGAIRGGVRFVAAYPITPATELLEWMAPALAKVGGTLLQAEDELASINMIIGASYGGVPSLTATAGPGLALMTEGIGLAVAAEVPIVDRRRDARRSVDRHSGQERAERPVVRRQRPARRRAAAGAGADLDRRLRDHHPVGGASGRGAAGAGDRAVGPVPGPVARDHRSARRYAGCARSGSTAEANAADYKRYRNTESGVSPMAIPGTPGVTYTADGLEHTEAAVPSSKSRDHQLQLDKRERKLLQHDYGEAWADIEGDGDAAVITFGSTSAAVREAVARARAEGRKLRLIALRLLAPAQPEKLTEALEGVRHVMVVEQNHSAQFYRYLRGHFDLPAKPASYHRPGPLPLRPGEVHKALADWRKAA